MMPWTPALERLIMEPNTTVKKLWQPPPVAWVGLQLLELGVIASLMKDGLRCFYSLQRDAIQSHFAFSSAFQFVTSVSGTGPFGELGSVIRKRRPSAVTSCEVAFAGP